MKKFKVVFTAVILTLVISSFSFANSPAKKNFHLSEKSIENLIAGISSDNMGLKISSAYMLGEYQCNKAVLPLLKILKSDDREEARIAAAVALYKIDDSRGLFAVKQAVRFDSSERVKKICSLLYSEHSKPNRVKYETLALN
jgi:hypothetical protein